jgi:hypothetical protein
VCVDAPEEEKAAPAAAPAVKHYVRVGADERGADVPERGRSAYATQRDSSNKGMSPVRTRSPPRSRSRPRHEERARFDAHDDERARTLYVKYIPRSAERHSVGDAVEDALRTDCLRHGQRLPRYFVESVSLLPLREAYHTWTCARVVLAHARDVRAATYARVVLGDARLDVSVWRSREEEAQQQRRAPQLRAEQPAAQLQQAVQPQQATAMPAAPAAEQPHVSATAPQQQAEPPPPSPLQQTPVLASVGGWHIIPGEWVPSAAPQLQTHTTAAPQPQQALPAAPLAQRCAPGFEVAAAAAAAAAPTAVHTRAWAGALAYSGKHRCNVHAEPLHSAGALHAFTGASAPPLPPVLDCCGTLDEEAAAQFLKQVGKCGRVAAVFELRAASADADATPLSVLAATICVTATWRAWCHPASRAPPSSTCCRRRRSA